MPYRDPPSSSTPIACEICAAPAARLRCAACDALTLRLDALEIPVVVVSCDWRREDPVLGVGMVLVDRWREIARAACRVAVTGSRGLELSAAARAALWAPTARIASSLDELGEALEDTLARTRAEDHDRVQRCFLRAEMRAPRLARDAREDGAIGTQLADESPP